MNKFAEIAAAPLAWAKRMKETRHQKAIGCLPMYVPEELIDAAGMLPVALPGRNGPVVLASSYLHSNLCHPVRGDFEAALSGELDFLDGLVFVDICDQTKRVGNLWEIYKQTAYSFHLRLPKRLDTDHAKDFFVAELGRFRASLEGFAGRSISYDDLRRSIASYNRFRNLMSDIYQSRRSNPDSFLPSEISSIVTASMVMPKEEAVARLSQYLATKNMVTPSAIKKARVVVCGNPCEDVEPDLLDMIGDVGATVVDDCVYSGSMYLSPIVSEDTDPLEALAQAYLNSGPCPTKFHPGRNWSNYVAGLVKAAHADGLVVILHKYCEVFSFDYQDMQKKLSAAAIPHVMLEVEHGGANARTKTMLQAFVEMLKGADERD